MSSGIGFSCPICWKHKCAHSIEQKVIYKHSQFMRDINEGL